MVPYLVFKSHSGDYHWQVVEGQVIHDAFEIGRSLLCCHGITTLKESTSSKCLIISLDQVDHVIHDMEVKAGEKMSFSIAARLWDEAKVTIEALIDKGCSIGLNFREVFLLAVDEAVPAHFRPGIDLRVDSVEDYRKEVSKFSYQLAKSILYDYAYEAFKNPKLYDNDRYHYIKSNFVGSRLSRSFCPSLKAPLASLNFFSGVLEARSAFFRFRNLVPHHPANGGDHIVVAFGPAVSVDDLIDFIKWVNELYVMRESENKELTIILQGPQYQSPIERQSLFDALWVIHRTIIIQVLLLTDKNTTLSLQALAPKKVRSQEPFVELPNGAGYYLHSPKLFADVYRYFQYYRSDVFEKKYKAISLPDAPAPQPTITHGAYIYRQIEQNDFRLTKRFNRQALKSKATLSLTQQVAQLQDIVETQEQSQQQSQQQAQQQQLTEVAEQTQSKTIQEGYGLAFTYNIHQFCDALEGCVRKQLLEEKKQARSAFNTQYGQQADSAFYQRLADDKAFRLSFVGRIFGLAVSMNDKDKVVITTLPNYSVSYIKADFGDRLLKFRMIETMMDGVDPTSRKIQSIIFKGKSLIEFSYEKRSDPFKYPSYVSWLGFYSNTDTNAYQSHLNYYVLLREEMLDGLSEGDQALLIERAESLLNLFKPQVYHADATHLEMYFFELIALYFKDNPNYLRVLKKFVSTFEVHHSDHLKIMLELMITGHRTKMAAFLELLIYLELRCLLDDFYKIYFKYAHRISVVSDLMDDGFKRVDSFYSSYPLQDHLKVGAGIVQSDPFLSLLARTPEVQTSDALPLFEKLCYRCLAFSAQHHMVLGMDFLDELEHLWRRLYAKMLMYTGLNHAASDALMARLVNGLITPEGLSIAPIRDIKTFLVVLKQLIDHAMSKGMLEEQLNELSGLSFKWMDVPYAIEHNGFHVVSSEMELHANAFDQKTASYSVSWSALHHQLLVGTAPLKRSIFRYLGSEKHREDLSFYRELFNKVTATAHITDDEVFVYEHLLGYFVGTSTGIYYTAHLDKAKFRDDFILFWEKKELKDKIADTVIHSCLNHFIEAIQQTPRDVQKGTTCLWRLWEATKPAIREQFDDAVPDIFTRKFEQQQLLRFIALNSESIKACRSFLEEDSLVVYALLKAQFGAGDNAHFIKMSLPLLRTLYPSLGMDVFIRDIVKIDAFIERYTRLVQQGARGLVYIGLQTILKQWRRIDIGLDLMQLLLDGLELENTAYRLDYFGHFLEALASKPALLNDLSTTAPFLALVLRYTNESQAQLPQCLTLCEALMDFGESSQALQTLTVFLTHLKTEAMLQFLNCHPRLTAKQLVVIHEILESTGDLSIALDVMNLGLAGDPARDFTDLSAALHGMQPTHIQAILTLCAFICEMNDGAGLMRQFQLLKNISLSTLEALVRLKKLHALSPDDIIAILDSRSILEAIAQFEREAYAQDMQRYDYDRDEVKEKIAKIKHKSFIGEDEVLPQAIQEALVSDYDQLMSYMTTTPVLVEEDEAGLIKNYTVNALNEQQCHALFERLSHQMIAKNHHHDHELMLLAMCCEALYRTTKKFPRNTQLIIVLNSLQGGHLIGEMKTGQGKSIVDALMGVLLCASGRTVDVATENDQLAKDGLNAFRSFYEYVGVPFGDQMIEANSPYEAYVANGINHSTVSNLALFRMRMSLEKRCLPQNISLVGDEIDAALTTTVQYRIAMSLNPVFRNTAAWSLVYTILLDFVKEEDLFLKNNCAKKDDIANFRNYFLLKCSNNNLTGFVTNLADDLLGELIDSAMVAHELEENIDYMVVALVKDKTVYYAAPILDSTKRPDPKVSFSDGLQQLLHTKLNRTDPKRKCCFEVEARAETLVVISAKNFFDEYRLKGGRIIGLTGTAGSRLELKEFYQCNGLTAFSYPTYKADLSVDLGLFWAFGPEAHHLEILERLCEFKRKNPTQPSLIITPSAKATEALKAYLIRHSDDWMIQSYNGYASTGVSEEGLIVKAGYDAVNTIANESLARGTDIDPIHSEGLLVVNTCRDITDSDLFQIQGRPARNGRKGQYCSIIDATGLGTTSSTLQEITENFKTHRARIAVGKQETRLKTRLLEDVRYHMVSQYFLSLRSYADTLLSPQFGLDQSLISTQDFLHDLRDFNDRAERHYTDIVNRQPLIDDALKDEFLAAMIADYQVVLNRWIPKDHFDTLSIVAPLIPLENVTPLRALSAVSVDQLCIMSANLSTAWRYAGHQPMQVVFSTADSWLKDFAPYFNHESSFRATLVAVLQQYDLIDIRAWALTLDEFEKEWSAGLKELNEIPLLGRFIPIVELHTFVSDYIHVLQQQIKNKKWDELALPKLNFVAISGYVNKIMMAKRLLIPLIKSFMESKCTSGEMSSLDILTWTEDIMTDIHHALKTLAALQATDPQNMNELNLRKVSFDFIKKIFTNNTFLKMVSKKVSQRKLDRFNQYLEKIPVLLACLDPYQERNVNDLLTFETMIALFLQVSSLDGVKQKVDETAFKAILPRMLELSTKTIAALNSLSLKDCLGFMKLMAHPNFFDFIKQLPRETTFAELVAWLNAAIEEVPDLVKAPLVELRHYQSNRERIEVDTKNKLLMLKQDFDLNLDKLKAGLERLCPPPAVSLPILSLIEETPVVQLPVRKTPWLTHAAMLAIVLLFVAFNVLCFSIPGCLTSLVLGAGGCVYLLMPQRAPSKPLPTFVLELPMIAIEPPAQPIHVKLMRPGIQLDAPKPAAIIRTNYLHHGLLGQQRKDTSTAANGNDFESRLLH